ncbi:MAG: Thiol-disulfide isomerase or thioredoxin [Ferruginibacter sp.]|nr:Thiol-disulfide isomerase or thioredoxin [Ferruginibacter sp.]
MTYLHVLLYPEKTFRKKICLLLCGFFFWSMNLVAQKKSAIQPLIISGQLKDCPEKKLYVNFKEKNGLVLLDSLLLDAEGKFYLRTVKLKYPQVLSFQRNNIQLDDIMVAPGYRLNITADGRDYSSIQRTKKITGIGAESNRYHLILDSIRHARDNNILWFNLNEKELLFHLQKKKLLEDSVARVVFDKPPVADKYLGYFGKMIRMDNKFSELYMLVVLTNNKQYDAQRSTTFIRNNFDNDILDNIFRDAYFSSEQYVGLMRSEYLRYLLKPDYQRDPDLANRADYKLEKVNKVYRGKIKERVLLGLIRSGIRSYDSIDSLTAYRVRVGPYVAAFSDPNFQQTISSEFLEKRTALLRTAVGKPAPLFALESDSGRLYRLEEFKGKVVYIDLWASWCGPCRLETPAFKKLYHSFKEDARIVFLGIAVNDGEAPWRKALKQDQPDWIQLLDRNGQVDRAYVATMIPKFIVIDKQGNIVSFDAPAPSSGPIIENLLREEMAK